MALRVKGLGFLVPDRQVLIKGFPQFSDAGETAPSNLLAGDRGKALFHLVELGTAGRGRVKVEPLPPFSA